MKEQPAVSTKKKWKRKYELRFAGYGLLFLFPYRGQSLASQAIIHETVRQDGILIIKLNGLIWEGPDYRKLYKDPHFPLQ